MSKAVDAYLRSIGLEVACVQDVDQAVSWLEGRAYPVRFILLAGQLATVQHREMLQQLRELCGDPDSRVIAMMPPGRVLPPGTADSFVLKPVRRSDLLQAMLNDPADEIPQTPGPERRPAILDYRPRVLVVDDNPMNLQVARAMLERLELEVHAVSGGADALSLMDRMQFRVILMDEQMPDMDGLETTRQIRARAGDDAKTPVVALTANADSVSEQRCVAAGMDGFLPKPVRRKALRALLSRWLPSLLDAPEEAPS